MFKLFLHLLFVSASVFGFFIVAHAASDAEITGYVTECIQARNEKKVASITDFYCPSGDNDTSGIPYTPRRIAYDVIVAALFMQVDEKAEKKITNIQSIRSGDQNVYVQESTTLEETLRNDYMNICEHGSGIYGSSVRSIADTALGPSDTTYNYPDITCKSIAEKKSLAWRKISEVIGSNSLGKSYDNDTSRYMDRTKSAYDTLLSKFNAYKRMVSRGVGKFTAFIKDAVK